MSTPKISIVLPVYNAENTISRMINSILSQTYTDWELIIVDDGSTDSSGAICDKYAENDTRIHIIHKENGGVAMARKLGVDNVQGEYIIHADADDWIESSMLDAMYKKIKGTDTDVVVVDYYDCYNDGKKVYACQKMEVLEPEYMLCSILQGKVLGGLCNKLMRACLYKKYNVCFFEDVDYMEDVLIWIQILQHAEVRISYINKAYYNYFVNENSITHRVTLKTFYGIKKYGVIINKLLSDENPIYTAYKENFPLGVFHAGYMNYLYTDEEIKEEFRKVRHLAYKTKSLRWLLGYLMIELGFYKIGHLFIRF